MIKRMLFTILFSLSGLASAQTIDLNNATNGACDAPCRVVTFYYTRPVRGELFLVEVGWAGSGFTATISDGVNRFHSINGPATAGNSASQQIWYAVNTGSPQQITVRLNGPTSQGWFDGMFYEVIGVQGVNDANPVDLESVASANGKTQKMVVKSGPLAAKGEMLWGFFLQSAAGPPYTIGPGWKEIGNGEAVSAIVEQVMNSTAPQIVSVKSSAPDPMSWVGVAFAVNPGNGGTYAENGASDADPLTGSALLGSSDERDTEDQVSHTSRDLARADREADFASPQHRRDIFSDWPNGSSQRSLLTAVPDNQTQESGSSDCKENQFPSLSGT